jgi:hypothetical protein
MMLYRGNGYLAPLIGLVSIMAAQAVKDSRLLFTGLLTFASLGSGVWVAFYGWRRLRAAEQKLDRSLHWYEWVFDPAFWKPQPFDSFMLIQMPWWSIGYAFLTIFFLVRAFETLP